MRATKAIINLKAIQHNVSVARQLAPKSKLMAVVKADAYGHGIVRVAQSLSGVDAIAVACMNEALTLREANIQSPIILLEGFFSDDELLQTLQFDLQTVIHQESQLIAIEKLAANLSESNRLKVWLKLDSGMNRLGFTADEYSKAYRRLKQLPLVESVNLMSHLACADDIAARFNSQQIETFGATIKGLSGERSLANSAGVVAWPESHMEWIRPGILLYGCSPMLGLQGPQHNLRPAMTLESQLFAIRHLQKGDRVGYGATWAASTETRIGVIAIGYGDGYPRHAKEGTPVLIEGRLYPLVGKVSMDMITVDLGMDGELPLGSKAILWGEGLPAEVVASHADTIPYTLLCGVTSRVKFEWQD
jgi:alanine racemase